ncbi:MAG: hypothetical protein WC551_09610 [Patescibacteria group bacterium]
MEQIVFEHAGALFGKLLERIPCGELAMTFNRDVHAFCYGWRFRAKGKELHSQYCMSALEIQKIQWRSGTPICLAEKIVEFWRMKLDRMPA